MPAAQAFVAQNAPFYNRKNNAKRPLANASNYDIISLGEIVQNMMDGVILLQINIKKCNLLRPTYIELHKSNYKKVASMN